MPVYEYRCVECALAVESQTRADSLDNCPRCGETVKRVWSLQIAPVMQSHLNITTGTMISDPRQFERALRQKGEEQTERTGIPHRYVPADHADIQTLGVTDEGLKSTYDVKRKTGEIAAGTKPVL